MKAAGDGFLTVQIDESYNGKKERNNERIRRRFFYAGPESPLSGLHCQLKTER